MDWIGDLRFLWYGYRGLRKNECKQRGVLGKVRVGRLGLVKCGKKMWFGSGLYTHSGGMVGKK